MSDVCELGTARLDDETGTLFVQCKGAAVAEDGTAPDFGEVPFMCALGVTSRPYPKTEEGAAEGILADDVPGMDAALIGARDIRTAGIVGNLADGDTVLHSTGPQQAAQVLCKEKRRQTVMRSKDERGKDIVVSIDGKGEQIMIAGFGFAIEMSRTNGIVLGDGPAALQIKDGVISMTGTIVLGGRVQTLPVLAGLSGPAGAATPGVFVGV